MNPYETADPFDPTSDRREFSRVEAYIPLDIQPVARHEAAFVNSRISGEVIQPDFKLMPSLDAYPRLEPLDCLNKKIDSIIRMMTLPHDGFHFLPFKCVSISGSGVRFSHKHGLAPGDVLEFKMILDLYRPMVIYVYGEVVQVEKQAHGYVITAQFVKIDDNVRDLIVRFVFERERVVLTEQNK